MSVSKLVALNVENIIWHSRKYNSKYVGFMTPLDKKVPDPCNITTVHDATPMQT